jgi:hypothetical protein
MDAAGKEDRPDRVLEKAIGFLLGGPPKQASGICTLALG